jgi:hypothetical protein
LLNSVEEPLVRSPYAALGFVVIAAFAALVGWLLLIHPSDGTDQPAQLPPINEDAAPDQSN